MCEQILKNRSTIQFKLKFKNHKNANNYPSYRYAAINNSLLSEQPLFQKLNKKMNTRCIKNPTSGRGWGTSRQAAQGDGGCGGGGC